MIRIICQKKTESNPNCRSVKVSIKLLLFLFFLTPEAKSEPFNPHHFNSNSFGGDHSLVFEIENVQREVMEPCRNQYINMEGISSEERINGIMDCLISHSNNRLNGSASHSNSASKKESRRRRMKTLPPRFGLQPPKRESIGHSSSLQILIHANDDGYSGQIEFDAVIPLEEPTQTSALFGQLGFILSVRDKKNEEVLGSENNSFSASTGLVYRFVVQDGILGFNLFYDRSWALHARSLWHERLSTGVDYQSGKSVLSFNYYYPLSDWIDINDYYEERAVEGADFSWKQLLTERWEGFISISAWNYKREEDRIILSVGMDYQIDCGESLGLALVRDLSAHKTKVSSQYKIALGGHNKGKNCHYRPYESGQGLLYRPVQRNKNIRLERDRKRPQLNIPDQYMKAGQLFSYKISKGDFRFVKSHEKPQILITSIPDGITYNSYSRTFAGTIYRPGAYKIRGVVSLATAGKSSFSFNLFVNDPITNTYPGAPSNYNNSDKNRKDGGSGTDSNTNEGSDPQENNPVEQPIVTNPESPPPGSENEEEEGSDPQKEDPPIEEPIIINPESPKSEVLAPNPIEVPAQESGNDNDDSDDDDNDDSDDDDDDDDDDSDPPTEEEPIVNPVTPPQERVLTPDPEPDTDAPTLTIGTQYTTTGTVIYARPVIGNSREGETYTITVGSLSVGSPNIIYNSQLQQGDTNYRIGIDALNAQVGQYTINGQIRDDSGNSSTWSFTVIVDVLN